MQRAGEVADVSGMQDNEIEVMAEMRKLRAKTSSPTQKRRMRHSKAHVESVLRMHVHESQLLAAAFDFRWFVLDCHFNSGHCVASQRDKFFHSGNSVRAQIPQIHWRPADRSFVFLVHVWCLHGNAKIDSGPLARTPLSQDMSRTKFPHVMDFHDALVLPPSARSGSLMDQPHLCRCWQLSQHNAVVLEPGATCCELVATSPIEKRSECASRILPDDQNGSSVLASAAQNC